MKKKVSVKFLYEGVCFDSEILSGVLIGGEKVLVAGKEGIGLYNAIPTTQTDVYIVDLDSDGRDFLSQAPEFLIDLVMV